MPARTALVIQHVTFEDLGSFSEVLHQRGYTVRWIDAPMADWTQQRAAAEQAEVLIVLGGPIGVYEIESYPFLRTEIEILQQRLAANRPTLGICLGAQLLAAALGAAVYPAPTKEIGWQPVQWTVAGAASPLAELGDTPVLHWHGDTFDLPEGAQYLASTEVCANQAFAHGASLALQFHPEVTAAGLERWLVGHTHEIAHTPGVSVQQLRQDNAQHGPALVARGQRFFQRWLHESEVGTPPLAGTPPLCENSVKII